VSEQPGGEAVRWLYGREGMPPSPGIQWVEAPPPRPPLTREQEWFKDLKFGMFIHWGLEALVNAHPELGERPSGDPAWQAGCLGRELEELGSAFDAGAWVELAVRAGQRYLCFTAKHHLGFANFASRQSRYTSAAMGPRRDFVRLVAQECRRRGMPFVAYLSLSDMQHPDFRPLEAAAWGRYLDFLLAQMEELGSEYGPLAAFWLDCGPWNGPCYRYPNARLRSWVRARFPGTLLMGHDWDEAEQGFESRSFGSDEGLVMGCPLFLRGGGPQPDDWPLECCDTLNRSWFHQPADRDYKDVPTLIQRLVEVVGRGGNYLLNHGPLPSGEIYEEDRRRLEAIGQWLGGAGEAIYGTRPLGTPAAPWGWPVTRGGSVYLHILRWPGERLVLPRALPVGKAHWLGGRALAVEVGPDSTTLHLPAQPVDEVDAIAVLHLEQAR